MQADTKVMDIDKLLNDFARACAFGDDAAARTQAGQAIKDAFTSRAASPLPVALPAQSVLRELLDAADAGLQVLEANGKTFGEHAQIKLRVAISNVLSAAPLDTSTTAAAPTDASRQEFQQACVKVGYVTNKYVFPMDCGQYEANTLEQAWGIWKLALASAQAVPPVAPTDDGARIRRLAYASESRAALKGNAS